VDIGEITWTSALSQAELVRAGEVSAAELVDAAIGRIEDVNPQINAVIHERFERARKEAAQDLPDGPFSGVPLLLKDLDCLSEGDSHTGGSVVLRDAGFVADHDSFLAAKFKAAGFVILGRTNAPEAGSMITTEPVAFGPTRNPWDLSRSSGGSSGGSAAAVAAGCTAVAHANDGGGSIRIPASECGLVGLKPSRGRVSLGPDTGESWAGSIIDHCVTRTVADSAAVLDAISGYMPGDPYAAPPPPETFAASARPGRTPRLRVGFCASPSQAALSIDPECADAVRGAGALLESLGHRVGEEHPSALNDEGFQPRFITVVSASAAHLIEVWGEEIGREIDSAELEPLNTMFVQMGRMVSAPQYLAAVSWLHEYSRRMAMWWEDHDILVTPVLAGPPPPIGWVSDPEQGLARTIELLQYTAQFNVTGQPAVSLPLHMTADGLPVGVQLVARYGREDLLLSLAADIEQAAPWADRRPPVHA
jgi:amidase